MLPFQEAGSARPGWAGKILALFEMVQWCRRSEGSPALAGHINYAVSAADEALRRAEARCVGSSDRLAGSGAQRNFVGKLRSCPNSAVKL